MTFLRASDPLDCLGTGIRGWEGGGGAVQFARGLRISFAEGLCLRVCVGEA